MGLTSYLRVTILQNKLDFWVVFKLKTNLKKLWNNSISCAVILIATSGSVFYHLTIYFDNFIDKKSNTYISDNSVSLHKATV